MDGMASSYGAPAPGSTCHSAHPSMQIARNGGFTRFERQVPKAEPKQPGRRYGNGVVDRLAERLQAAARCCVLLRGRKPHDVKIAFGRVICDSDRGIGQGLPL